MRLAIIDDTTGIVHPVLDRLEEYNLDVPLARAEVAIAVQLEVRQIARSKGEQQVIKGYPTKEG